MAVQLADQVRTIRLYGKLGAQFGRVHRYVVNSPREAIGALAAMVPGFGKELMTSEGRGIRYAVFVGKRNIGDKQLEHPSGSSDIRIAPILAGSKHGGIFQTILGGVMMIAGAAMMFASPGMAPFGRMLFGLGLGVTLGGVAQMISPHQQTPQNLRSYNFNGAENTTDQGGPVSLLYGEMRVGSTVISEGLLAEDGTAQLVGNNYVPTTTAPTGS
ncbi:tail assembly protein [Paraburkholderia ferrariae]|uniref:tail assembly protein n=1 Tax=Paraburkholderia ferrariae TaxID=386056 RepID=UPI0005AA2B03|nr:tail assembly protein [Paraburkholderia ferrariae]